MGAISCGASLIKYILFAFNLLWLILGAVVLYLGFKITNFSRDVTDIDISQAPRSAAIVLLVTGFVIFLIAFLGCCGAIKESYCMLSTYGAVILLLVIVQCVGAYLAFKYHHDIQSDVEKAIDNNFEKFQNSTEVKKVVNKFQKQFECCGAKDYTDWQTNHWMIEKGVYPGSCCQKDFDSNETVTCTDSDMKGEKGFRRGCVQVVVDSIKGTLGSIGGVAIGIVLIQLLIVVSACCLAREVR